MEDLDRNLSSAVPMLGGVIIGKYCDISNLVEHPVPVYPPTHRRQPQAIPVMLTKKVTSTRSLVFVLTACIVCDEGHQLLMHFIKPINTLLPSVDGFRLFMASLNMYGGLCGTWYFRGLQFH